jgi:bis(5'-nucleosidyl)-tetraphosphatase
MEISAGTVVFRRENNKIMYLLLHYPSGHWEFPKGHVEQWTDAKGVVHSETPQETALRELEEETGISDGKIIKNFKEEINYFFRRVGRTIQKKVVFFLAETSQTTIILSEEHIGSRWLPYKEALEQTTFANSKGVLKESNRFLT